jgi:DNA-binding SARP family transcriptional activator
VLVLGPIAIVADGVRREFAVSKRSAVLARLIIAGGRPVTIGQFAEDIWDTLASDAEGTLRVAISRVRDVIGRDAIVRSSGGYAMNLDAVELDVTRFERLVSSSPSSDPRARLDALDEALALVRGPPFAGLQDYAFVGAERARLDELRERAIDERFGLLLDAGGGAELISEIEAAARDQPLNERRCGALVIALYRAGRQADALAALRRTANLLRDELGLSLSPGLRDLEQRLLHHDRSLFSPEATSAITSDRSGEIEAMVHSALSLARARAWEPALRLSTRALDAARSLEEPAMICRSLVAHARITFMSGEDRVDTDPVAARGNLEEATAIARRRRDGSLLALVASARFMLGIGAGDDVELVGLTEPLDYLPTRAAERIELLGATAAMVSFSAASLTADRVLEQIDALADEVDDPRIELIRLITSCVVGSRRDASIAEIDSVSLKAVDIAGRLDDPLMLLVALHARLLAELGAGNLDGVELLAPQIERAAREALAPFGVQRRRLLVHALTLARGELENLVASIDETAEVGRRMGAAATAAPLAQKVVTLLELGEHASVVGFLDLAPREGHMMMLDVVRTLARAELCFGTDQRDAGEVVSIEVTVDELVGRLADVPDPEVHAAVAAFAAELAWWTRSTPLARWALSHLGAGRGRMVTVGLGTLIVGAEDLFAGLCHDVLGDRDRAVAMLESGLGLLEATSAELLSARARLYVAAVLRERGHQRDLSLASTLDAVPRPDVPRLEMLARFAG